MGKDSFVFYRSWVDAIKELPDKERLFFYDAITEYGCNGIVKDDLSPLVKIAFNFVKDDIDRNQTKWEDIRKKRSEAGKKGGAPKGNTNAAKQAKQAKQAVNVNVNDNVNVNVDVDVNEETKVSNIIERERKGEKIFEELIEKFNFYVKEHNSELRKITSLTDERKADLKILFDKGYTKTDIETVFEMAAKSDFQGVIKKIPDFDWIIKEKNFVRIGEGNFLKTEKSVTSLRHDKRKDIKNVNYFWENEDGF